MILEEEKRKFIVEDLKAPNKTGQNKPLEKKVEGETSQPWTYQRQLLISKPPHYGKGLGIEGGTSQNTKSVKQPGNPMPGPQLFPSRAGNNWVHLDRFTDQYVVMCGPS